MDWIYIALCIPLDLQKTIIVLLKIFFPIIIFLQCHHLFFLFMRSWMFWKDDTIAGKGSLAESEMEYFAKL